jgi:predicted enzyme related to lactoylglutathione lyase
MRIRTCYFKVSNLAEVVSFWQYLLNIEPVKSSAKYCEFRVDNINLGLLLNDFGDQFQGSNCVPVFEFPDSELPGYITKAKDLGCSVILDGLDNPNLLSIVFADPWGNEFELSRFHDDNN